MARNPFALAGLVLISTFLGQAAHAADTEVCILSSTETRTNPRKPNIFETKLDCGQKPSMEQERLAGLVNNAMNAVDGLEIMTRAGYEIETASWRDSYTGHQVFGLFTLVRAGEDESVDPTLFDEGGDAALEDLDMMSGAPKAVPADEADATDFTDSGDDELDIE